MRKFGVEIEALGIAGYQAVRALTEAGIAARDESHTHRATRGISEWSVVYDGSLHSSNSFEAVAPPGHDLVTVRKAVRALRAAGATVGESCGLHVHVDANGMSLESIRRLHRLWLRVQGAVRAFLPRSRKDAYYARNNFPRSPYRTMAETDAALAGAETIEDIAHEACGGRGESFRYHKLNTQSYWKHGTFEFRCHQGTLNAMKVSNWIQFCQRIVALAEDTTFDIGAPEAWTLDRVLAIVFPEEGIETGTIEPIHGFSRPRAGTRSARLWEIFDAAPGPVANFRYLVTQGFSWHVVRGRHSEWSRRAGTVATVATVASPARARSASAQARAYYLDAARRYA